MNKDNKKFIVETLFLKESLKHNLSLKEFLVLMYFDNEYDYTFDVRKISKATCLSDEDVLTSFGILLDKKLIVLNSVKDEKTGKFVDKVSLDNLYNGIKNDIKKKSSDEQKMDFFTKFQESYSHSLGPMDYEIINGWLNAGNSEELILGALKEANYNGVLSLRYIDKILFEWNKKGFKKMSDVENHIKTRSEENTVSVETNVLEYNWLDEE